MKHAPIVALALMAALVAGCGGGSSTRITDLEEELAAAQAAQEAAQEEARKAEEAAEEAAEAARLEAARQAAAAREAVEEQLREAQEARQEAESKATELEDEAGHTADQLVQANAEKVFTGLVGFIDDDTRVGTASTPNDPNPDVTPRYRESASVDTDPAVTFSSITTGTSGNWFSTLFSHRGGMHFDRLDVYTDRQSPGSVPFRDSVYKDETNEEMIFARFDLDAGTPNTIVYLDDEDNQVVGSVQITGDRGDASASGVPEVRRRGQGVHATRRRRIHHGPA